ncbi:MAG: hypothetical protein GY786_15700 [Proteobacteria bacterium]|nr:hypothetical protein [Pseudomonadota bacterium]
MPSRPNYIKYMRDDIPTPEAKLIGRSREKFLNLGITSIPDQHDIGGLDWLKVITDKFSSDVDSMKTDWERFKVKYKLITDMKLLDKLFLGLADQWLQKYGITMVDFGLEDRCMMTIYDTKWNSDAKDSMIPKVSDLHKKILNNLHTLLEEQEDPPVLTEVTLLAWGTKDQHIHCDYSKTSFNKATKETEVFDPPPALPNKRYGTVIYHFHNN